MPIHALLFDLDGTLVDTLADVAGSMNATLEARGLPTHATSAYTPWISEGVAQLVANAHGGEPSPETVDALVGEFRAHYAAHMLDHSRPYAGILGLLDALDARALPMAVLTNKTHGAAIEVVGGLFPSRFRHVIGQRVGFPPKPDPMSALELCAVLGVAPAEAALVGDSEIDVRTARAAGLRAIACTWGFRARAVLVAERPDAIVDHPEQVLAHLG